MHTRFKLKPISIAIMGILSIAPASAYKEGVGAETTPMATIESGEIVRKVTDVTPTDKEPGITGVRNRDGDPVRMIWYGHPGEADGEVTQTGAVNDGFIYAGVNAKGIESEGSKDYRSTAYTEAVANGIDAYGWTPENNTRNVEISLDSITNNRTIEAKADIDGFAGKVHGDVSGYGSSNGISVRAVSVFGEFNLGGGGSTDGMTGASGRSARSAGASRSVGAVRGSDPSTDPNFVGKDIDIALGSVSNTDSIKAKIDVQAAKGENITNQYTPQFYNASAASSGNGVALSTFIKTIDKFTFSEDRKNNATLGKVDNSGVISGAAKIKSGTGVTHTNTYSNAAGNGVSVNAETDKFAKSSTRAKIGNVDNSGEIIGDVSQISGDNSGFKSIHVASTGNSVASGNGISSFAEIHNVQTKRAEATVGDITNKGKISGSASVTAGNGSGDLSIKVQGSGNGVSSYLIADGLSKNDSSTKAGIGAITNDGMITGHLKTRAGVTVGSAQKGKIIPEKLVALVITDKDNRGFSAPTVLPRRPDEADYPSYDHTINNYKANSEIKASGNGISAFKGNRVDSLNNEYVGAKLGDVKNKGVISGYAKMSHGMANAEYRRVDFLGAGTGIFTDQKMQNHITNIGLISGNHAAILAKGRINGSQSVYDPEFESGYDNQIKNYGLMAGTLIAGQYGSSYISNTRNQSYEYYNAKNDPVDNKGTKIYLKEGMSKPSKWGSYSFNKDYENIDRIEVAENSKQTIDGVTYDIINAPVSSDGKDSEYTAADSQLNNTIINGAGIKNGALIAEKALDLANSVVNGYGTALNIKGSDLVKVNDSTLNANGFDVNRTQKTFAILGDKQGNKVNLSETTTLNGNVDFQGGDDTFTINDNKVKINSNFVDMGDGVDNVIFGGKNSDGKPINVNYQIKNVEKVEVNQSTKLYADANLSSVEELAINDKLIYQINPNNKHALDNKNRSKDVNLSGEGTIILDTYKAFEEASLSNGKKFVDNDGKVKYDASSIMQTAELRDGKIVINAKLICKDNEHEENGKCVKNETDKPLVCGEGTHEENGQCVKDETDKPLVCGEGTHEENGKCVKDETDKPLVCGEGTHEENGKCVKDETDKPLVCGEGTHEENGKCVKDETDKPLVCGEGTHEENGQCVKDETDKPLVCGEGTHEENGQCVKDETDKPLVCGEGTHEENGQCVKDETDKPLVCGEGTHEENGQCVKDETDKPLVCGEGTHEENGQCVKDETDKPLVCGEGTHEENGKCVKDETDKPLVCSEGTHEENGKCVKDETDKPLVCGEGTHEENGQCLADKKITQPTLKIAHIDAYDSIVSAWENTDVNLLGNSSSVKNKSKQAANKAINDYLDKVVNENIYAELPNIGLNSLQSYRGLTLDSADKMLEKGKVYTTAAVSSDNFEHTRGVKDASKTSLIIGANYGVENDLTAGISVGTGKESVNGYQNSKLSGNSVYISPYIKKGFQENQLLWTTGLAYESLDLDGRRNINNGYDSHTFKADVNGSVFSVYTQLEYDKPLSDMIKWTPKVGVAYNVFNMDAIKEKGVGGITIDDAKQHTVDLSIGQSVTFTKPVENALLSGSIGMDYTYTTGKENVVARFTNSDKTFDLNSDDNSGAFGIGADIKYENNNGFSLKAGVKNRIKNDNSDFSAKIQASYEF